MPKTPNIIRETTEPSETPKRVPFTIVPGPGTDAVAKELGSVHDAILHDATITADGIASLDQVLTKLTIDVGGVSMTLEEAAKDPNLKKNAQIWKELLEENYDNIRRITFLPAEVAIHLAKRNGPLFLDGLTSLSDIAAQHLAHHQGYLGLSRLLFLSDTTAQYLSNHQGHISLESLTSLSDKAAEHLANHQGQLGLDRLTYLSDKAAEHLAKHQGWLGLPNLTFLSDTAAIHLATHQGTLELPENIRQKVDSFKSKK